MNIKNLMSVFIAAGLVSACSSDDSSSSGGSVSIATVSGVNHTLAGTYTSACYGGGTRQDAITVTANVLVNTASVYEGSTDCSGTAVVSTLTGTLAGSDGAVLIGWRDGDGGNAAAPEAADGSGTLPGNPSITLMNYTISESVGDLFAGVPVGFQQTTFYVVDDTGTGTVIYRAEDNGKGTESASIVDPFIQ